MGFIDTMRAERHAVESICRVLRAQDCQIAARTYRAWRTRQPAARTITDAQVVDVILDIAWTSRPDGVRRLTPEGLHGRRKMTALLRRTGLQSAPAPWTGACEPWGYPVFAATKGSGPRSGQER